MLRKARRTSLTVCLPLVVIAALVRGPLATLFAPKSSFAQGRWQVNSSNPDRAYGVADEISEQEAILRVVNELSYVQKASPRSASIRNLRNAGPLALSGSYPMFPTASLPWRVALQAAQEPAAATFDVISDWETFGMDVMYVAFLSLMQLIPTPTGCLVEPFVKSEQGIVFLIEMSPYFDSVVDNLVAGDTEGAANALTHALKVLLQELPSRLHKVGLSCFGAAVTAATTQALPGVGQVITTAMIAVKVAPIIVAWISYPKGGTTIAFTQAHPILGKWQRVSAAVIGGVIMHDTIEFLNDGRLGFPVYSTGQTDTDTFAYKFVGKDLLIQISDKFQNPSYPLVRFRINGDRLVLSAEGTEATWQFQRLPSSQSSSQGTPPASQATTAVQPTQIAAQRTRTPAPAPKPLGPAKAPLAPTTRTAAARLFIQVLASGDTNSALQLMPASAQATFRNSLPGISLALRACSASQTEASELPIPNNLYRHTMVRLTPPCGNYGQFYDALPRDYQQAQDFLGPVTRYRNQPIAACNVSVTAVNDQWRISYLPGCFPPGIMQ